jgi:hypothetical protein
MSDSHAEIDPIGAVRELSHEHVYQLWQAAKLGGHFEGDDAQLVQAMHDHPEYYEIWDHAREFGQEQMTIGGVTPLMHVLMHTAVENQAAQNNPPQVRAVLEYKMSHQMPRHEAVHEIANEFAQMLWLALHDHQAFDNDAYRKRLDRLLSRSRRIRR